MSDNTLISTPDLCDQYEDDTQVDLQIVAPVFSHYSAKQAFCGSISTVQCFEDNSLVAQQVKSAGHGRVLVVDGDASMRCSLLGDQLAAAALKNGWAGIIINGCLRDVEIIAPMPIGIMAIASIPRKTVKAGKGSLDVTVTFAGAVFSPGHYVYADQTGILVSDKNLLSSHSL